MSSGPDDQKQQAASDQQTENFIPKELAGPVLSEVWGSSSLVGSKACKKPSTAVIFSGLKLDLI